MLLFTHDFGPYVALRPDHPDGRPHLIFAVPAADRPPGWRAEIPLPLDQATRPAQFSDFVRLVIADADKLYRQLGRERDAAPFRVVGVQFSNRSQTLRWHGAQDRYERRSSKPPPTLPRPARVVLSLADVAAMPIRMTTEEVCATGRISVATLWRWRKADPAWLPAAAVQGARQTIYERGDVLRAFGVDAGDSKSDDEPPLRFVDPERARLLFGRVQRWRNEAGELMPAEVSRKERKAARAVMREAARQRRRDGL